MHSYSHLWPLFTASEDALWDLRPGHQLRPADSEQKRPGDRPVGLRDPHERRSHRGPSEGRGPAHELARHSSLQPTEGAAEPTGAAQHKPRRGVCLLGTEQLHETGRERSRLQQPQTDEATDAWTQALHHLSDQNVKIWWTLQKGNGDWQVNVSKEKYGDAIPFSNTLLSILALILAYQSQVHKKGAGNYNFSFHYCCTCSAFFHMIVALATVTIATAVWTKVCQIGPQTCSINSFACEQQTSRRTMKCVWIQSLLPPAWEWIF